MKFILLIIFCILSFTKAEAQTDSIPTTGTKHTFVEVMPEYIGGTQALYQHLVDNLHYPKLARQHNIQGKVFVTFVIEKDGSMSDIKVLSGPAQILNDEAIRVVKTLSYWKPGMQDGKLVRVQMNLPINFALAGKKTSSGIVVEGISLMNAGFYEEAIEKFSNHLSKSKDVNAYYYRGICFYKLGKIENACKDWKVSFDLGNRKAKKSLKSYCK